LWTVLDHLQHSPSRMYKMSHFCVRAHTMTPTSVEKFPATPRWHRESCRWPSPRPAMLVHCRRPRLRLVAFTSSRSASTTTASSLCYRSSPLCTSHGGVACRRVAGTGLTHARGDGGDGTGELGVARGGRSVEVEEASRRKKRGKSRHGDRRWQSSMST
jgi:hypothetical protein